MATFCSRGCYVNFITGGGSAEGASYAFAGTTTDGTGLDTSITLSSVIGV